MQRGVSHRFRPFAMVLLSFRWRTASSYSIYILFMAHLLLHGAVILSWLPHGADRLPQHEVGRSMAGDRKVNK